MDVTLFTILSMSFLLGIKHAIEPDHMIAVSTIASQTKSLWRSTLAGVFWGIGHTVTLLIVGLILIVVKGQIPVIGCPFLGIHRGDYVGLPGCQQHRVFEKGENPCPCS